MNANQKIESAFEALDLELEILTKAQQQVVLGGSGDSSGGGSYNEVDTIISQMFDGSSNGTFFTQSDVTTTQLSNFKQTLRAVGTASTAGKEFLKRLQASHAHINLTGETEGAGKASYVFGGTDYSASLPGAHSLAIGGIPSGSGGANLLAHELFHAYQDKMGIKPHKLNTELDAYMFGSMIGRMYGVGTPVYGQLNDETPQNPNDYTEGGQKYQSAMYNSMRDGYSDENYDVLQKRFLTDSAVASEYIPLIDDGNVIQVKPGKNAIGTIREFLKNSTI